MNNVSELQATIKQLTVKGKGILAADESIPTITKRFQAIDIESTEETRRTYRELLFTTPKLSQYVSGVILFEETLNQSASDGLSFEKTLEKNGIVPGIKVDKGLVPLNQHSVEQITQGLDGLAERLVKYKSQGARFAKWRAVYTVSDGLPTQAVRSLNAVMLARYASICQDYGIVPIVEPEVLIDGDHTLAQCAAVTEKVLQKVFCMLNKYGVILENMILKPSMVIAGKKCKQQSSVQEVAESTICILKRTVPAAVPSINFLSGGQTPEQATAHLKAMNVMEPMPWHLSFSYARALQEPCMNAWKGQDANKQKAQAVFYERARLNHLAILGE